MRAPRCTHFGCACSLLVHVLRSVCSVRVLLAYTCLCGVPVWCSTPVRPFPVCDRGRGACDPGAPVPSACVCRSAYVTSSLSVPLSAVHMPGALLPLYAAVVRSVCRNATESGACLSVRCSAHARVSLLLERAAKRVSPMRLFSARACQCAAHACRCGALRVPVCVSSGCALPARSCSSTCWRMCALAAPSCALLQRPLLQRPLLQALGVRCGRQHLAVNSEPGFPLAFSGTWTESFWQIREVGCNVRCPRRHPCHSASRDCASSGKVLV
jgi:hypothetical protein